MILQEICLEVSIETRKTNKSLAKAFHCIRGVTRNTPASLTSQITCLFIGTVSIYLIMIFNEMGRLKPITIEIDIRNVRWLKKGDTLMSGSQITVLLS